MGRDVARAYALNVDQTYRLAVDIGGTFTDIALAQIDGEAGTASLVATTKTPTIPTDLARGALAGTTRLLAETGVQFSQIQSFIHGTTLATNALIERRGAKVATITTAGFRDILEIGYERRYSQYDINIEKPDLIVPRHRSLTIGERADAYGTVLEPLDRAAVPGLISELDAQAIEAVAVCFLHAYANPAHEQELAKLLRDARPDLTISLSSDVSPEAREFERLCTTVANAYVQPLMARYLADLAASFGQSGLRAPILLMTSGGGMTSLETAQKLPIRLVESGPSGGAILAARLAEQLQETEVLSFDMGGTTAKLCLIDQFRPQTARHFEIARAERFIKGSGMPVRIPVVEMIEIGAGGGSIASVDRLFRLNVGPKSAGADPGPAAFAKGGSAPTVTDADVTLGYIDPDLFAEGRLKIDRDAAQQAIGRQIGTALGLSCDAAALGISQIVDENMASAGRMHGIENGKDLAVRTMIAFGGNGPLHASRVARRAGVKRIVIPHDPGVGSAVGFLTAAVSFELIKSRYAHLSELDTAAINALFDAMIDEAAALVRQGSDAGPMTVRRRAFMRYHGQGHEIEIDLPDRPLAMADTGHLRREFEAAYAAQFTRAVPGMVIEILNWAVHVEAPAPIMQIQRATQSSVNPTHERREIIDDETGEPVQATLVHRAALAPGDKIIGPALIVEPQTTTLVSADFIAEIDSYGHIVMTQEIRDA